MADKTCNRDAFIEENLLLVHSLCKRFVGRGIEYDDLYQAGCMGLVKATDAFDTSRGLCFSTYAVPVILGEIRRLFRDGGSVKVSRSLKEFALKVSHEKERMEKSLGREPAVSELAKKFDVSPEEITEALCVLQPTLSLTSESDEKTSELDIPVEDMSEGLCDRITLDMAFKNLDETERELIKCRYYRSMTQTQTAAVLSMSQVQVSRSEKKILKKLRGILEIGA